jgi:hypothetical protein
MRALILEDDRDRRVAMIGRLAERFPFLQVLFFDASEPMIEFLESNTVADIAVISLDHDLEMKEDAGGKWIDPGTGLEIARWLARQSIPFCPVVVHTTNSREGEKMIRLLVKNHWTAYRVVPQNDLHWIDTEWFGVVRNAIVDFVPPRQPPMVSPSPLS